MGWEELQAVWHVFVTNRSCRHCWNMQKGLEEGHSYPYGAMLQAETTLLLGSGVGEKKVLHKVRAWPWGHCSPDWTKRCSALGKAYGHNTLSTGRAVLAPALLLTLANHVPSRVCFHQKARLDEWHQGPTSSSQSRLCALYPVTWVSFHLPETLSLSGFPYH